MNIVVSCAFSNPVFSQNNNYELNNAKISATDFYDTIAGKPVQKSVLLLWIDTGYVNPATINDTSNIVRPFGDFVTPAFTNYYFERFCPCRSKKDIFAPDRI